MFTSRLPAVSEAEHRQNISFRLAASSRAGFQAYSEIPLPSVGQGELGLHPIFRRAVAARFLPLPFLPRWRPFLFLGGSWVIAFPAHEALGILDLMSDLPPILGLNLIIAGNALRVPRRYRNGRKWGSTGSSMRPCQGRAWRGSIGFGEDVDRRRRTARQ
jgi:hypothetical protein